MASPSNASEPESPDEYDDPEVEEEEDFVDTRFDALLFWDRNRQAILIAGGIILLALVAFGIYEYNQGRLTAAAGAALAQAVTEDDYRAVMSTYPGTIAAGNASLLLAGKLRAEHNYDDAIQVLQTFLANYPTHPLASAADLSIGETLEAQGRVDDAMLKYQEVAAKYPDSYSAPIALMDQANILQYQGKIDDARRIFENFVAQFPDSVFAGQAMAEMHLLRPTPGAAAEPTPETNPENLPTLTNPQPPAAGGPPAPTP